MFSKKKKKEKGKKKVIYVISPPIILKFSVNKQSTEFHMKIEDFFSVLYSDTLQGTPIVQDS